MTRQLLGPLPEPADTPAFPTPWTVNGADLRDAAGRYIASIASDIASEDDDQELAKLIVELANAHAAPADAKPYRAFRWPNGADEFRLYPDGSVEKYNNGVLSESAWFTKEELERYAADERDALYEV